MKRYYLRLTLTALALTLLGNAVTQAKSIDPFWNNATVYFMMTDRFNNGDAANDKSLGRKPDGAVLRSFMGGDIKGITQKIESGYFTDLGVDVLWMTPLNEQVHGIWQEDWGDSYPFHGYWPKDWTAVDPNFGSEAEMQAMISAAHKKGIRVLADVILNHTGPETKIDVAWPDSWIRTTPLCDWNQKNYANNVGCNIATSLTEIKTDTNEAVELPDFLLEKWRSEGRLEQEMAELDAFFERSKLPRAPKNYIIKWITDWVRDYGIDGFRVDTAKHVEAPVWKILKDEASLAFNDWKRNNPDQILDDKDFFMIGEVFHFGLNGFNNSIKGTRLYDYGDRRVDFFDHGFDSLINMGFATHAAASMEELFSSYSDELHKGPFQGVGFMNYVVSHDDPSPYDPARETPYKTALKLMLAPGAAQIYYGDETARKLNIEGAIGDAHWRSFMNWQDLQNASTKSLLSHWQKLGKFRRAHLSVGAGVHTMHNEAPYIFSRRFKDVKDPENEDKSLVVIDANRGIKVIEVYDNFPNGTILLDYYSGQKATVTKGKITLDTPFEILLLAEHRPL